MYYKYSVLSETGTEVKGIDQGSSSEVRKRLSEKKYYILSLEADFLNSLRFVLEKRTVKAQTLAGFFEDLVNMLKVGIGINEAVAALQESTVDPVLTSALSGIGRELVNGFSLEKSFEKTGVFPWLVLNGQFR